MGGWGRPQKIVSDGGWIDYSYGKGSGDAAKGGWDDSKHWQNRGDRGSGGAKNSRSKGGAKGGGKGGAPRGMPAWTAGLQKTLDAMVKAAVGQQQGKAGTPPAKAQDAKKDTKKDRKEDWCCPCGFKNFGFRADCKECGEPKQEAEAAGGVMEVDCGLAKPDPPEKVAKELRNVLSTLTGLKGGNLQGNLMISDAQMKLRAAEGEIRQGKPALVRLQTATRQKEALAVQTEAATRAYEKTRAILEIEETALKGFKTAMGEIDDEISEIQAELGRPQLEAGSNAAVQ